VKALTLWQPWASLCVLRPMCDDCSGTGRCCDTFGDNWEPCTTCHPFKTIETRSWPAPKALIGQRIAIHAAKRKPEIELIGEWNTGLVTCFDGDVWWLDDQSQPVGQGFHQMPLGAVVGTAVLTDCVPMTVGHPDATVVHLAMEKDRLTLCRNYEQVDVSDQGPFGVFAPYRWAWLLADVEPCDPIPAVGRQGIWNWEPSCG